MSIFKKRVEVKPYEFPEIMRFRDAIKKSRWDIEEFNLDSDAFQYKYELNSIEQRLITRALLAISQVEINVKTFWGDLYRYLPKTEFSLVGATCAENEVVHFEAYQKLIEVLGMEDQFAKILEVPCIAGRIDYLSKYLNMAGDNSKERFSLHIALFSSFIENTSLFAQFAIPKTIYKNRHLLKEIDSVIDATMKEEIVHAQLGGAIINLIRKENPHWFGKEFEDKIIGACYKAFEAECNIVEWMFEGESLDYLKPENLIEFIKSRFNDSLELIGIKPIFKIEDSLLEPLQFMVEAIYAYTRNDFFDTQSTNYTKFSRSVSRKDLF